MAANLSDHVRVSADRRGEHTALIQDGQRLSWRALDAAVDAAAWGLRADLETKVGDRVALVLGNTPAFVTAYFAILRAGLVAVPVNTGYTAREMAWLFGDVDVRAVLCEDATLAAVEEAVAATHRVVVDPAGFDALVGGGARRGRFVAEVGGEDLALLLHTSGTSGRPRAAMLTHRALLANLEQCAALERPAMTEADIVLAVLPLFHVYGLNGVLGLAARCSATVVLAERFDPQATLDLVRAEQVTNIPGAPPMYVEWADLAERIDLRAPLSSVRLLGSGAAPLPVSVLRRIEARTGLLIREGYGLTETSPVLTTTLASARVKPGSVGRPVPGVETRLVDEQGTEVEDEDPGEIWARGPNLFSGYWPDGSGGPDEAGWFATGDVAYADDDGDLFLVDRRRELVLVNGFNVYPREVEEAVAEHPDVAEVAVIGIPDPATGEAVKAYVVLAPGAVLRAEDVVAYCVPRLARFKRPTVVEMVDELPHSATGKIAKGRLRAEHVAPGGAGG